MTVRGMLIWAVVVTSDNLRSVRLLTIRCVLLGSPRSCAFTEATELA